MIKKGFTLIELVVVVSIILILVAIGTPFLMKWVDRNSIKNFSYDLAERISYARNVSKKDGKRVVVAIIKAGLPAQNWTGKSSIDPIQYLIFEDDNNDLKYEDGEKIISYGTHKNINILDNTISRKCMNGNNGRCIVFFPVGPPLVGSVDRHITIGSINYDIKYDVALKGVLGIPEVNTK